MSLVVIEATELERLLERAVMRGLEMHATRFGSAKSAASLEPDLTAEQVGRLLFPARKDPRQSIYALRKNGALPASKRGKEWYFTAADVRAFQERNGVEVHIPTRSRRRKP